MGLLKKMSDQGMVSTKKEPAPVSQKPVQTKSNSVGLLKKSLIISNDDGLDFFEFIEHYNIQIWSLLKKSGQSYVAEYSAGLDGKSICNSLSTDDFWQGLIKENKSLYTFNKVDNSLLPLLQFFSKAQTDSINSLYVFKADDERIIFFKPEEGNFNLNISTDLLKINSYNLEKFINKKTSDKKAAASLYTLDFSEAIESYLNANYKNNYDQRLKASFFNAIYLRMLKHFPNPSFIKIENQKLLLSYALSEAIPKELLYNHIIFDTSFLLYEHSKLLVMEEAILEAE